MWLIRNHAVKCKGIKSTEFYVLRRNYFHTIHIEGPETHSLAWKRMIVLPQMQHNKVCLVQCAQMRLKFNQRCNSMLTACYCGSTSRLMRNMMQFYWIKVCSAFQTNAWLFESFTAHGRSKQSKANAIFDPCLLT